MQEIIYEHPSILNKKLTTISKSFYFRYNKQTYFIGIHHGYPIKYVNINGIKTSSEEYNICYWNEILFKSYDNKMDQFVFNKFSKKQIDSKDYYYCDKKRLKFKSNYYFPINMMPWKS